MKTFDWEVKIVSSHRSALNRQVTETTRISREEKSNILNSKNEFGSNNIPEIEVRYGTKIVGGGKGGVKRKRTEDPDPVEEPTQVTDPDVAPIMYHISKVLPLVKIFAVAVETNKL